MTPLVLIDRGGTFTDCLLVDRETGAVRVTKVLSSDDAPLRGIRELLGLAQAEPIPPCEIRMGTTLATNALLERRGARTALLVTAGFPDLLAIADQRRPELFALRIEREPPPVARVEEVSERLDAAGRVLVPLDTESARAVLARLQAEGIESLAIALLHAHQNPAHESELGGLARAAGFRHVALSHEVVGEQGYLARAATTAIDAYLTPVLRRYASALREPLARCSVQVMQSAGGLMSLDAFRGRHALLSGPAGGAVAVAHIARELGIAQAIGIDLGGTSTDVCRTDGELPLAYESTACGLPLRAPQLAIHSVAAGGGSICRWDGQRMRVGPESAGADPGPLCYGKQHAGELTSTDVCLALGRLPAQRFPFPLDRARVEERLRELSPRLPSGTAAAAGFFEIAVEHMAQAIRKVTVSRGHDPREHTLVVFGGAGGQYACPIARRLGIRSLIFHPYAGALSAFGMGVAETTVHLSADAGAAELMGALPPGLAGKLSQLGERARRSLLQAGHDVAQAAPVARVDLRYRGTDTALTLPLSPQTTLRERFVARHVRHFGYAREGHAIEIVTLRVELRAPGDTVTLPAVGARRKAPAYDDARLFADGAFVTARVVARESLSPGDRIDGPAIVLESIGTIVLDPGFCATLDDRGYLRVDDRGQSAARTTSRDGPPDPVRLEVFANHFMSVAEEMGLVLGRTALSTNIRERMDYSCAVFDARGDLVANAPHIPVHLGAMSESVRAMVALHPAPEPGDAYVTNDPRLGGSHLPDITVVTPVFGDHASPWAFTASRGHHADVGGLTPGSMPPFSRTLADEGVVLSGLRAAKRGALDEAALRRAFTSGPYPARDVEQNLADLRAQLAANQRGAWLLGELSARYGRPLVTTYMRHLQDDAERAVRAAIARQPRGVHRFEDAMDDGSLVVVTVEVRPDRLRVDFTGSAGEHAGNLNAPRAVTVAAVLYVLRVLARAPIPLNAGCLRPIDLVIPEPSMLSPSAGRAVAAGNVETSQRVVDVLLGALGAQAACQGTMNNLTFGDESFGYYETLAGGAGAGPGWGGASGVHTHMTNTRITDPEVLESRYPVRLWRFSLRRGSGGEGEFRGGDGVIRELEPLRPLDFSIVSERRARAPFGLCGGEPGAVGKNLHAGRELPGSACFRACPGERVRIETPGGGGYGPRRALPR